MLCHVFWSQVEYKIVYFITKARDFSLVHGKSLSIFILFYQYVVMNKNNWHFGVTAQVLSALQVNVYG